ncbi:hypothetical protein MHBO_000784 [Bonamia ostreae]|uniref:Uncharacterized protein n=1 Tax=Bonamia ostreae TaxID=126728 RepID=A0ABV2AGT1_9EUKA
MFRKYSNTKIYEKAMWEDLSQFLKKEKCFIDERIGKSGIVFLIKEFAPPPPRIKRIRVLKFELVPEEIQVDEAYNICFGEIIVNFEMENGVCQRNR